MATEAAEGDEGVAEDECARKLFFASRQKLLRLPTVKNLRIISTVVGNEVATRTIYGRPTIERPQEGRNKLCT